MNPEKPLNVLLVEDDKLDQQMVGRLLSRGPLRVNLRMEESLVGARSALRNGKFDAILLDLGLPDSRGIDTLVDLEAFGSDTPVVVCTGQRDEELALQAVGVGAQDLVHKEGLTAKTLDNALLFAINRHRDRSHLRHEVESLQHSMSSILKEALTDPLTDIPNRRSMEEHLAHISNLEERPYLVAGLIDLDDFKRVNDVHGHAAGDAVLKAVAARILSHLRDGDFAARVGGDEFVVLFNNLGHQDCLLAARRIVEEISRSPVSCGQSLVPVTATVALASMAPGHLDLESILVATHQSLEEGKTGGKARVVASWERERLRGQGGTARGLVSVLRGLRIVGASMAPPGGGPAQACWVRLADLHTGQMVRPVHLALGDMKILGRMSLNGARRLNRWIEREGWSQVHMDLELSLLGDPDFCRRLAACFSEKHRRATVLFFNMANTFRRDEVYIHRMLGLIRAGFSVGLRGLGDGAVTLDALAKIRPAWVRISRGVVSNLERPRMREYLTFFMPLLRQAGVRVASPYPPNEAVRHILAMAGVDLVASAHRLPGPPTR